ncbi:MAG: SH3 domain-containing protein [Myxococcota bacterium]|jgi:hypothetical protein|nr:hypothetical protein [Myxococcales bacterium]MEC7750046.1 SH3 domain-containing protein [Myxococcota bacterium]HBU47277.1 hypothetical protein [Myxococcales bacterium]|tara:strand:+ start:1640 stop:2299 length:660 start_codon:yes stop_codon:yes gene_type:complete
MMLLLLLAAVTAQDRLDAGDPNGAWVIVQQQQATDAVDYYNRGYVAHAAGETADAVLNYLRAERLGGPDEILRFNLLLSGAQRPIEVDAAPPWPLDLPAPLPSGLPLEWLGFIALVMGVLALRRRLQGGNSIRFALTALALCGLSALAQLSLASDRRAVATQPQVLRMTPVSQGESLAQLERGQIVRVLSRQGDWIEVAQGDGLVGWAKSDGIIDVVTP